MHDHSRLSSRFADFVCRLAGTEDADLRRAATLAGKAVEDGRVWAGIDPGPGGSYADRLRSFSVVGAPGDFAPLVLDDSGRIFLFRYWKFRHDLFAELGRRGAAPEDTLDRDLLEEGIRKLFPGAGADDRQGAAARTAVTGKLCVITGGPGTGKTWTAIRTMALLADQARSRGDGCSIALAAPTGKAVARMCLTVANAKAGLDADFEIKGLIPDGGYTVHRLLGAGRGASRFRHDRSNPLPYDVVVVDEASMVDLAMMSRLACAVRPDARLILLGDRHQLASVEPGRVFGEICSTLKGGLVVELTQNHRFAPGSGIAMLADAVRDSRASSVADILDDTVHADVSRVCAPAPSALDAALSDKVLKEYTGCVNAESASEALAAFDGFRILCALRKGPYGSVNINAVCESILERAGLVRPGRGGRFEGRPIMITRNDYSLGLFNGDSGMLWREGGPDSELVACFPDGEGGVRRIHPGRLPPHETCWAVTVHKSQGSEFDRVLLILPDRESPVVTRELLYTAITRARSEVRIVGGAIESISWS